MECWLTPTPLANGSASRTIEIGLHRATAAQLVNRRDGRVVSVIREGSLDHQEVAPFDSPHPFLQLRE
jgi:hypothetical protein